MQNKNSPGVVLTNYRRFFFSFRGIYMTQKRHAVQSFGQRDELITGLVEKKMGQFVA